MSEQRESVSPRRTVPSPGRDTDTVCIACKLPNGLILQLCVMESIGESAPQGHHEVKRSRRLPEQVTLKGTAVAIETLIKGDNIPERTSGYALTYGVSRKFWEEWLEQYKDSDLVKNKMVFAAASEHEVRAEAKDYANVQSGLEPIDPNNPASKSSELRRVQRMTKDDM